MVCSDVYIPVRILPKARRRVSQKTGVAAAATTTAAAVAATCPRRRQYTGRGANLTTFFIQGLAPINPVKVFKHTEPNFFIYIFRKF